MILGTRPIRLYPEVIQAIGKFVDIFGVSAYKLNSGYKISIKFDETIQEICRLTGRPIMLGVLISAQDTELPFGIVKTQEDRGISYCRYIAKVASHSSIVGLHWFQYFDLPIKCYDMTASNWGLVNERDEPYKKAIIHISRGIR